MNPVRAVALLIVLVGIGALAYGGWRYFDDRDEIRIGDTRLVVETADVHPTVWVGAALVIAGGVALATAGSKKS